MPYRGVTSPAQRLIYGDVFSRYPVETFDEWQATVLAPWHAASFREERYVAAHAVQLSGLSRREAVKRL
jgi:hypothetical protein